MIVLLSSPLPAQALQLGLLQATTLTVKPAAQATLPAGPWTSRSTAGPSTTAWLVGLLGCLAPID